MNFYNGIDRDDIWLPLLNGKRVGVLTHGAACSLDFRRSLDVLSEKLHVVQVWGPEHGLDGVQQAGENVDSSVDRATGLPVTSLMGERTAPSEAELENVDVVVCDFCDIGSRGYTYLYTMSDTMQRCAAMQKPFVVLDRGNPLGGVRCEGTVLEKEFSSFVGRFPIPVRHGLTIGEAAILFNERFNIHSPLTVVPLLGWERSMEFECWNRPWINPSPNIPSADTARIFPGCCYLEGTNLSEGRGTTRPFELIGAPFIDPIKLEHWFNLNNIPGIQARGCYFEPSFSKFAGERCGGIQLLVTDRTNAQAFAGGVTLLNILRENYPEFKISNPAHFNALMGSRRFFDGRETVAELIQRGRDESSTFQTSVQDFLLY